MQIGQKLWPARSANTLEITQKNFHVSGTNIGGFIWGPWGEGGETPGFPPLQILIPISFKSAQGGNYVKNVGRSADIARVPLVKILFG